jgi:hypothetical protein
LSFPLKLKKTAAVFKQLVDVSTELHMYARRASTRLIDSDFILPYVTHCLLVSWHILPCKIRNLYGAPKQTVRYIFTTTITHCRTPEFCRTRCLRAKLSILQSGETITQWFSS